MSDQIRVRRSLYDLQNEFSNGNKKPLEDLMRAWKGIKELPPTDPRSFFMLGGLHGEPFRGAGWGNSSYWGGYCNHGNVLFPTWHRVYMLKLEDALRSIPGCEDVTLPFWDEASEESAANGIPWALTDENFVLDGATIPNPLRSFVFTQGIEDFITTDNRIYSKPKGYETVRYPLSGLVGNPEDLMKTKEHNAQYPDYDVDVRLLNKNVVAWLTSFIVVDGQKIPTNVRHKYEACLNAPNYTVFSNTSSAAQWNFDNGDPSVVPVESPHNDIHLSVGGFDVPGQGDESPIPDANGDMGENDTAALDPIFYFHHCFVDCVFWLWQQRHGATNSLEVIEGYPGTNSVDNQGPTPGIAPNAWLTLETPLNPFNRADGKPFTSLDCINIEKQLGYTYGPGSLEPHPELPQAAVTLPRQSFSTKKIRISGINRGAIRGSFLVSAFATIDGKRQHLGTESVLSRWNVQGCANCQTHLDVKAQIALHAPHEKFLERVEVEVEVRTRDGLLGVPQNTALPVLQKKPYRVQVL